MPRPDGIFTGWAEATPKTWLGNIIASLAEMLDRYSGSTYRCLVMGSAFPPSVFFFLRLNHSGTASNTRRPPGNRAAQSRIRPTTTTRAYRWGIRDNLQRIRDRSGYTVCLPIRRRDRSVVSVDRHWVAAYHRFGSSTDGPMIAPARYDSAHNSPISS